MTYTNKIVLLAFLLLVETPVAGHPGNSFEKRIESINTRISEAYIHKNSEVITSYYNSGATCMPEYHKTLYNKSDISDYFQQWFAATNSNTYSRTIYKVEKAKDYLVEIGTFRNDFTLANDDSFHYKGKYLRIWRIEKNKSLTIISDIWGADDYLDRSKFPSIQNTGTEIIPRYSINQKVKKEVENRNQGITELVINRQGEQHSTYFSPDAIYMPYYKPMLTGIDSVKSYFIEHEKAGDITIDSLQINAGKIIDLGNIIFEQGYYGVKWRTIDSKNAGVVTGKSINIWKRNEKGILMLYRQMVNHD